MYAHMKEVKQRLMREFNLKNISITVVFFVLAASARIQPVFRSSLPRIPSRNFPADTAIRSRLNNGRIHVFISRSDCAQSSSVVSTDAPAIHDLPNHGGPSIQKFKQNATVMLVRFFSGN